MWEDLRLSPGGIEPSGRVQASMDETDDGGGEMDAVMAGVCCDIL